MEDKLISFATAKLAKEKGFDLEVTSAYEHYRGNLRAKSSEEQSLISMRIEYQPYYGGSDAEIEKFSNLYAKISYMSAYYTAPSQSLLQKWLREKHNISVEINTGYIEGEHVFSAVVWNGHLDTEIMHVNSTATGDFFTYGYEDALEDGLVEALNLIKK